MEKFDKNYIIGFVLLFLMYGGYMYFYNPAPIPEATKTAAAVAVIAKKTDSVSVSNSFVNDSLIATPTEKLIDIENEDIIVSFSSRGGAIKKVTLKKHQTYSDYTKKNKTPMVLFNDEKSKMDLSLSTTKGILKLSQLVFNTNANSQQIKGDEKLELRFVAEQAAGSSIEKIYTLSGKGYAFESQIKINNQAGQFLNQPAQFSWENNVDILENDLTENRKSSQINYYDNQENFEDIGIGSTSDEQEKADLPVKWFSFKQKYFTEGLVSKNGYFNVADFKLSTPTDNETIVKIGTINAQIPFEDIQKGNAAFTFYFGPNDLSSLQAVGHGFQQNLYLGYDIVKPINKYVFVPLFNWVESYITNYGLLIIIVVLIIKFAVTPLIYKSYVSSAKMRLLAPEINEIKAKVGDDAVKVQQETMKLYQQVGVSPLSGCVPLLLQMPILMSVFFLFPNMLMFRQKTFLWSYDLSTYDAPISWAANLPIIGNHISLFVVLMTLSSLAFTYYNNQITPDQPGPVDMKKLSYVFPLVFFFVLNSFPAALSFYYLVSNLVTIGQQLIVRKFIDEDKIRSILEQNKINYATKPQKKSKFGDFIQKQLQASEEMKKQADEIKKKKK
jgi:YidC/Oxa1 family membrane protein insertase